MVLGHLAGRLAVHAGAAAIRAAARERREARRASMYRPVVITQPGAQVPDVYAQPSSDLPSESRDTRMRGGQLCMVVGCQIFLYILAVPVFIASMVLFSISAGGYDYSYYGVLYYDCPWWPGRDEYLDTYLYDSDVAFCDEGKEEWDAWVVEKQKLHVIAVVLLVLFLASLLTAIILSIVTCVKNCCTNSSGDVLIHHEYPPAMSYAPRTVVTTVSQPQTVNPIVRPCPPPAYSYTINNPYGQASQGSHMPGQALMMTSSPANLKASS